jgi:1A family penicillin-binding protein
VTAPDSLRRYIRAHHRAFVAAVVVLAACLWLAAGVSAWFVRDLFTGLPDRNALRGVGTMAQATTLLDVHDRPAFTIFQEQRIEVPLSRVSRNLVRAVIAIEDQRFYDHGGVDVVRVVGAALNNLREGRAAQGGSTITQQLARASFLTRDKTFERKLKEMLVAARLEKEYSKDQILQLYLNKVYFGNGLYGAEAASLGYFGKSASDLDVAEAALLAGLVKSPSTYAPTSSLDRAVARRNVVLQAMLSGRAIDRAEYERSVRESVHLNDVLRREESYGQYFKEEVRKQLVDKFGWQRVYQSGLRVHTTIDLDMQKSAEAQVMRGLEEIEKRQVKRGRLTAPAAPLQAALVAIDPQSGEVRAIVGGRDFNQSHFNRAIQARRQPGSAFKPFVYAAALERGYTPATLITNLNDPVMTLDGEWVPEDEHLSSDTITMRTALRTSSNRAAVRMIEEVGIPETVRYAEQLGVGSQPSVPSLALGSGEVTLASMSVAYAAFVNGGMVNAPVLIRRVETTDGSVIFNAIPHARRAVSEATAFIMTSMMADVINAGTGWQARRVGFMLPAAGKTGTTNDYNDAWFVGYTPHLVTGVWVGYDQPRTIIANGYAADLAVPIWGRFMKEATANDEAEYFRAPANIVGIDICRMSGKLATDGCHDAVTEADDGSLVRKSMVYTEYFVRGTEPIDFCPLHGPRLGDTIVGTMGGSTSTQSTAVVPPNTSTASAAVPPPPPPPAAEQPKPEKKRGFWARFFGVGDKKDKEQKKAQKPPQ